MNQEQLEALLRQIAPNGQPERLEFSETTETVEVETPDPYGGTETTKKKVPVKVLTWIDRGTGQTLKVQADPATGTYTKVAQGVDPKMQGAPAVTPAQVAADEQGVEVGSKQKTDAQGNTVKVTTYRRPDGTTYEREDSVTKAPAEPKAGPPKKNAQGVWVQDILDANGNVTGTRPVPADAVPKEPSKPPVNVSAPSNQRLIEDRVENPDGTYTVTTRVNPNWKPETKVVKDDSTGKWIQISETAEGGYTITPVNDQTVIKPTELPVLQAKYGEISQGLGQLAADLNGRFARGEITEKQRNDAFAAGHQQAATQISEINSILETSRAAWGQQIQQRGQTLSDTQGRRAFAGDMIQNAVSTGNQIAISAGPGHGAAIAGGVAALMGMGQRYAEGMGGLRESPEIPMPAAIRQAQEIGLPGFQVSGSGFQGTGTGVVPPETRNPTPDTANGVSQSTDAGGVPRVFSPASSSSPRTQNPAPENPAISPLVSQMAQQLQGADMFSGEPVAAGGMGVFDPMAEAEQMMMSTAGGSGTWADAVKRAAADAEARRQRPPAYQRFLS